MNLRPPEVIERFKANPLYSHEGQTEEAEILVKYFNPCGLGTWLITEAEEQENGDWLLFGLCHIFEWEWGYVMLSELETVASKINSGFFTGIEIDNYFPVGTKIKELSL